jgi:putative hemolysin
MLLLTYLLGVFGLCIGLAVIAYVDRIYLELTRVTSRRVHAHLEIFEAEIEPGLRIERGAARLTFRLLSNLGLVVVAAATIIGVTRFSETLWEVGLQGTLLLVAEVVFFMHLIPYLLLTRNSGRWLQPFVPILRLMGQLVFPLRALLEVGVTVAHLHEEKPAPGQGEQEGLEALVEAAEDQGILEPDDTALIEQVIEFGDKRVREVMTPRPDVVAISATASIEELRTLFIARKYSRVPVYEASLDEPIGIAYARDVLAIPERDAARRVVRELVRPIIFVPETKLVSELLREMQQKKQQMAIAIDEYGNVAGVVTAEDLVEEIVGEIGEEDRTPAPDAVREADGSFVLRGSLPVEKLEDLFGVPVGREQAAVATTVAGLLNEVAGHVPVQGEVVELGGMRFQVLDANQRKVLRLRARLLLPAPGEKSASAAP